jgi:hypothetical protein
MCYTIVDREGVQMSNIGDFIKAKREEKTAD